MNNDAGYLAKKKRLPLNQSPTAHEIETTGLANI